MRPARISQIAVAVAVLAVVCGNAWGQQRDSLPESGGKASRSQGERPADGDRTWYIGTYEVGDLVVDVPNYMLPSPDGTTSLAGGRGAYGSGGFGGGSPSFGQPGRTAFGRGGPQAGGQGPGDGNITIDELRGVITSIVAPDSWGGGDQAGERGRIEVLGSALVVSNTTEVHQMINGLLGELRRGSATRHTVAIDARWLMLDSNDLDRLVPNREVGEVDRAALEELTRRAESLRGMTKCFSGQAVYLISGTRRNVVSSYIPVVGSADSPAPEGMVAGDSRARIVFAQFGGMGDAQPGSGRGVGYQPVIEKPNFGVTLELRPTLAAGVKEAIIDLKSTVTFPVSEADRAEAEASVGPPRVDRLAIQTQEFATTLRVSLGKPELVGGMTYLAPTAADSQARDSEPNAPLQGGEQRQLYLVIELR